MNVDDKTVLVFGATGQQGGAVADALLQAGWKVRAFVRDPLSARAKAIKANGIELVRGDMGDADSIRVAMAGAHGVFSVQPSSGQGALYGVSDADEVRFGTTIADLAVAAGILHLVYSSTNAAGPTPSGMGHFDSKSRIETHIRSLPIASTIIRPSAFMEMLLMPGFGLPDGPFTFFMRPDQTMQFIAVEDIGRIVAAIFADPERFRTQTIEIAGDTVTGDELAAHFSRAAGRPLAYQRFPDAVLAGNPFLAGLAALVDDGRLSGHADLAYLRTINPALHTFATWLEGSGKPAFAAAMSRIDA